MISISSYKKAFSRNMKVAFIFSTSHPTLERIFIFVISFNRWCYYNNKNHLILISFIFLILGSSLLLKNSQILCMKGIGSLSVLKSFVLHAMFGNLDRLMLLNRLDFDKFSFADLNNHAAFHPNLALNILDFPAIDPHRPLLNHTPRFAF